MSNRLRLALIALAVIMLVGCRQPIGMPSEVHAATTQTTYCYLASILEPTGRIEWYQQTLGLPDGAYDWYDDTIRVAYIEDITGRACPPSSGVCVFAIPPFDSPNSIPTCTLYYYQLSHTESGEDEPLLVNSWRPARWPPLFYVDRYNGFWAMWTSTDTVATDVIHEDDGWQKVPLSLAACEQLADSGATDDTTLFWTGWVYHGTVDSAETYIAGYENESNLQPYIKIVYDDGE